MNAKYKVTGMIANGRWLEQHDCWEVARITPRFFSSELDARHFFETLERGILWKKNPEGSRNEYSVYWTLNCAWPEGARKNDKKVA